MIDINKDHKIFSKIRWTLIGLFLLITLISGFAKSEILNAITPIVSILAFFIAVGLHGIARYGIKNIVVLFVITWLVSNFFEALSIRIGFPFGHYYYDKLSGPRLFDVPLIIMLAYFGMGYISWILSTVLTGQYAQRLIGSRIFFIPLIATFIMVIWDLCMDPINSTIGSLWVWKERGSYFGVPLKNYFGWFLVVYIIFQLFGIYISKYEKIPFERLKKFSNKFFWMETSILYGIQALLQLMYPLTQDGYKTIYESMALVTFFTMGFITLLSIICIQVKSKAMNTTAS